MKHRIVVIVKEAKTKDGRVFPVYQAVTKNGALVDLKFRKEVKELPTAKSIITVDAANINEEKRTAYPCWWVAKIDSIEPFKVDTAANEKRVADVFGDPIED